MHYWWVNQGQSYEQERGGGYLWAPIQSGGRRRHHWDSMTQVSVGDRVIHYARTVRAISTVTASALETLRPQELPDTWENDGRLVRCSYADALVPIRLDDIPREWRAGTKGGPFTRDGKVNLGYLFPLSDDFGAHFMATFGDHFGERATPTPIPAEALESATDLLRRLIGVTISTVTGSPNRVVGVQPPDVLVATERSPGGAKVPISDVEQALDRLRTDGAVTIHPSEIGYRSAFVGAVLLTLPGARATGSPPVIQIDPTAVDPEGATVTFDGDLDRPRDAAERGEQARLRRVVFGTAPRASCSICGKDYPVAFLRAAHIKRRSACSDEERRDLSNVAMPACLFGCDTLYELGFVAVGADGRIEVSSEHVDDPALGPRLLALAGRRCATATSGRLAYYAWHRANVFRGVVRLPSPGL
jgi:hypothetical protein